MKIMSFILNNEEKKEMLEAFEEFEALKNFYKDKYNVINRVMDVVIDIKNKHKKDFYDLYTINHGDYEDYTLKLAEDGIKMYINSFIKEMEKKPSDAVVMYFIKIFTALFYLYYDIPYLKKMRKF